MVLVTLVPAVAAAGELHTPQAAARLDDVVVAAQPDVTTIRLKTSGRPKYQAELLDSPVRVVVDLEDTVFAWRPARLDADGPVRQVRGSQYRKGVARVVVELTAPANYTVKQEGDSIAIVLTPRTARAPLAATAVALETAPAAIVDLKPVVLAQAQRPPTPPPPPAPPVIAPAPGTTGRLISLDFKDADVVNLLRILAAESGKNIIISDDVKGKMSITLKNVPWEQALDIIMQARSLTMVERGNVIRIVTNDQLAKERDAAARLEEARVRAEEAKSKAEVEVRQKAAEAAVKEQEAIQKKLSIEQQLEEIRARGPIREETIRLAYADPEDVARTLIGILGITPGQQLQTVPPPSALPPGMTAYPTVGSTIAAERQPPPPQLISPEAAAKGITIQAHRPTNSIFIRHYEKDIERIKKLIRETLDVELPMIRIEGRVITISRTDLLEVGVQWGGAGAGSDAERVIVAQGSATPPAGVPGVSPTITPFTGPAGRASLPLTGLLPVSGITGLPLGGNLVNLPLTAGAPAGGINFGIIGTRFNINLAIQALEAKSNTRILARPEVVVTDNNKATIVRGTEIGYAVGSANTGFSVAFRDAALKLEVTPTVIREPAATKIKMKVNLENNTPGAVIAGVPSITKQTTTTEVVVKEGETLVVGGVTQRTDAETVTKVPLFGDIPVVGWLFKRRLSNTNPNDELAVFITPSILRDIAAGARPTTPATR